MDVTIDGKRVDFEAAAQLMDDEVREKVHSDLAPCSEQEFADAYCREHAQKFGEPFQVN